jgi:hypothetical protein
MVAVQRASGGVSGQQVWLQEVCLAACAACMVTLDASVLCVHGCRHGIFGGSRKCWMHAGCIVAG